MSNWIKFSDRMPTEADADTGGYLIVLYPDDSVRGLKCFGTEKYQHRHGVYWLAKRGDLFWLANVPRRPKPRTMEDLANGLLAIDAQLEVLERKDLGMLGEVNNWDSD